MLFNSRVTSVSYDHHTHRFEGEVEFQMPDGDARSIRAAVVGTRQWPFEKVSRELLQAARFKVLRMDRAS